MRNLANFLVHHLRRPQAEEQPRTPTIHDNCLYCDEPIRDSPSYLASRVCPFCRFHYTITARERIELLADRGSFRETHKYLSSVAPLSFARRGRYAQLLAQDQNRTGLTEAAVTGRCKIDDADVVLIVLDFSFMGGTMGSVVGEKVATALETASKSNTPAIAVVSGGGVRVQEGVLSLMQMAKTVTAANRLRDKGSPFIVVLANPSTGQAYASFANLADVILAEPKSLIGLSPLRTLRETSRIPLPLDAHTAEAHVGHGLLDNVVDREALRARLSSLLRILQGQKPGQRPRQRGTRRTGQGRRRGMPAGGTLGRRRRRPPLRKTGRRHLPAPDAGALHRTARRPPQQRRPFGSNRRRLPDRPARRRNRPAAPPVTGGRALSRLPRRPPQSPTPDSIGRPFQAAADNPGRHPGRRPRPGSRGTGHRQRHRPHAIGHAGRPNPHRVGSDRRRRQRRRVSPRPRRPHPDAAIRRLFPHLHEPQPGRRFPRTRPGPRSRRRPDANRPGLRRPRRSRPRNPRTPGRRPPRPPQRRRRLTGCHHQRTNQTNQNVPRQTNETALRQIPPHGRSQRILPGSHDPRSRTPNEHHHRRPPPTPPPPAQLRRPTPTQPRTTTRQNRGYPPEPAHIEADIPDPVNHGDQSPTPPEPPEPDPDNTPQQPDTSQLDPDNTATPT